MTNTINYFKLSTSILFSVAMFTVFIMTMFIFVPKSYAAEYPNIIMGQNMTVGSTGQGVVVLQGLMSELGFLNVPDGIPFGYYGGMTRDAVAKYQSSTYVTPAVGYYGPVTKSSMYNDFSNHGWLGMLGWQ